MLQEKTHWLIIFIILFFLIILISLLNRYSNNNLQSKAKNNTQLNISTWIATWDENLAITSLQKNRNSIKTILPVWYQINSSGEIEELQTAQKNTIFEIARKDQIAVLPSIFNNFDKERVSILLSDKQLQNQVSQYLVKKAIEKKYQGYDIDFEEIKIKDKEKYSTFIRLLADTFHKDNLLLSVTVHAQTGSQNDWIGSKGQDYITIGKYADQVRIMVYDFHDSQSLPGAITPLDKLDAVLSYATSAIPREKIIIGLPLYGYDWINNTGTSLTYLEVQNILNMINAVPTRDKISGELTIQYYQNNKLHTIWFNDNESLKKKIDIITKYNLNNISFWRLGGEEQNIWKL